MALEMPGALQRGARVPRHEVGNEADRWDPAVSRSGVQPTWQRGAERGEGKQAGVVIGLALGPGGRGRGS